MKNQEKGKIKAVHKGSESPLTLILGIQRNKKSHPGVNREQNKQIVADKSQFCSASVTRACHMKHVVLRLIIAKQWL